MTQEEKKKIIRLAELHNGLSPEFSCHMCKSKLKITTCKGCPVYCENYSKD